MCPYSIWAALRGILIIGAVVTFVALVCLKIRLGDSVDYIAFYALLGCLAIGSGFIALQSVSAFCVVQPVAIGHTFFVLLMKPRLNTCFPTLMENLF